MVAFLAQVSVKISEPWSSQRNRGEPGCRREHEDGRRQGLLQTHVGASQAASGQTCRQNDSGKEPQRDQDLPRPDHSTAAEVEVGLTEFFSDLMLVQISSALTM